MGLGAKYRAKWKSSPYVELVTMHFERPRTWTMHNGGAIEVTFTCRLEPVPEGTRLHAEFEPRPHGWFQLIFLLIIRREEKANMTCLREHWSDVSRLRRETETDP